jgi:hypothetical protein
VRTGALPSRRSLVAALAALLLLACGKGGGGDPAGTSSPRRIPTVVTFTQIWVGYATPNGPAHVTRTKAAARALAESLVARIRGGEPMDPLVRQFSDDREPGEEPFNGGSYTKTPAQIRDPEMRRVVFSLEVGETASAPVDSGIAFHVIRRDL